MIHENEIQAGDYVYVHNSYNTFGLDFYGTEGDVIECYDKNPNGIYPDFNFLSKDKTYHEFPGKIVRIKLNTGNVIAGLSIDIIPVSKARAVFRDSAKKIWEKLPLQEDDLSSIFLIGQGLSDIDHRSKQNSMRYLGERKLISIYKGKIQKNDIGFDPFPDD